MKITATLLKFGEDSIPDMFGDVLRFAEDAVLFTDDHQRIPLLVNHNQDAPVVGYADRIWSEDGYLKGEFSLLDTPAAQQAKAELAAGVRRDVSVAVRPEQLTYETRDDAPPHPVWGQPHRGTITLADVLETSLCLRGRMPSAQVDAVSTDDDPSEGEQPA